MEPGYKYSVLMSVYVKEKAVFLREAMNSIWGQTIPTDNFVLVCDGPLTPELDAVIDEMGRDYSDILHIVRLEKNCGLGNALNIGIKYCKNELVARMDSDDISRPERCEKQLSVFQNNPEVSIVSGIIEEFTTSKNIIEAKRVLPEKQNDIVAFAKKRNPFNHPCVMYRKTAVKASGGYQDFYLLEDYYLWVRMLQNGFAGYNLQEPLLWMRAGSNMYKRRSGLRYVKSQQKLFKYMKETGFINNKQYLSSIITRGVSSISPNAIREHLFKTFMRS